MKLFKKSLELFVENNFSTLEKIKGGYLPPRMWPATIEPVPGTTHDMMNFQEWTKKMTEENGSWQFGTAVPADYTGDVYWSID